MYSYNILLRLYYCPVGLFFYSCTCTCCRNYGSYLCTVVVIPVVKHACVAFLNMCVSR